MEPKAGMRCLLYSLFLVAFGSYLKVLQCYIILSTSSMSGCWLPFSLIPLAAGHRDPPREGGAGAQGDGSVPRWPPDKQGRGEGGPAVTGELCHVHLKD